MSEKTDIHLLNQMASIDGEAPFEEIGDDLSGSEELDADDFSDVNSEQAFAKTAEWRDQLRLPESTSAAAHRLGALINNFESVSNVGAVDASADVRPESLSWLKRLRQMFSSFGYSGSGVAIASSFAVLLLINQGNESADWVARYAELGDGEISKSFVIEADSEFFTKPSVQVRGEGGPSEYSCSKNAQKECDFSSEQTRRALIEKVIAGSLIEPVLRATEKKGLFAARLPDEDLWLLIRADIERAVLDTKSDDRGVPCRLVEAVFSDSNAPPLGERGFLLSYCPAGWTNRLSLL